MKQVLNPPAAEQWVCWNPRTSEKHFSPETETEISNEKDFNISRSARGELKTEQNGNTIQAHGNIFFWRKRFRKISVDVTNVTSSQVGIFEDGKLNFQWKSTRRRYL